MRKAELWFLASQKRKEKPPRAEAIAPVPRVHELADRLREAARACIEPLLGALQVRGIVTHGDSDGVVLFRTTASLTGPHRVAGDGHAFIRRGPSSVQMTMREIQDLTLDLARGADRLEALFSTRAELFAKWLLNSSSEEQAALRITAVPLGSFPSLGRIPADLRDFPFRIHPQHDVVLDGNTIQCTVPSYQVIRPVVRGVQLRTHDDSARIQIFQTGLVDMWLRQGRSSDGKHFYIRSILGSYLSILGLLDSLRVSANSPDFEFVLELALAGRTGTPRLGGGTVPLPILILGGLSDQYSSWRVEGLPITLPRIISGRASDRSDVLNLTIRDLFDATGEPPPWNKLSLPT
jgi:hypothetical protein